MLKPSNLSAYRLYSKPHLCLFEVSVAKGYDEKFPPGALSRGVIAVRKGIMSVV